MHEQDRGDALDNPEVSHEQSDVPLQGVLVFFVVLIVVAALIHLVVWGVMMQLVRDGPVEHGRARPFLAAPGAPPPGPQFEPLIEAQGVPIQQVNPAEELRVLRRQEAEVLRSLGWRETPAGLAAPIERMLEALEAEGARVEK